MSHNFETFNTSHKGLFLYLVCQMCHAKYLAFGTFERADNSALSYVASFETQVIKLGFQAKGH